MFIISRACVRWDVVISRTCVGCDVLLYLELV